MKPIVNYGLSDSLIDAVRKSIEEASKGDGNLANNYPPYDKVTRGDVISGRLGKDQKGGKKNTIDTKPKLKEEEQIDELSNKTYFAAYKAADRKTGSAAIERDGGIKGKHLRTKELAYKGVKRNNAKQMGQQAEDIEQMDEISSELARSAAFSRIDRNMSKPMSPTDHRKLQKKGITPLDQQKKTTAGYMKTLDRKNEEYEQMDEANSDNPEFEGRLAAIDMHHYKEADHHRKTLRTLGTQGKLNTPEGKFHTAALEKHQFALNAMAASDHERMRKKLKQSMRSNLKREEVEQMDEAPLRAVNALVGYPKLNKKVAAKGTPGSEEERNKAAAGLKDFRSGLGRRAYTGDQHYDVRREEEQMDEGRIDDLKDARLAAQRERDAGKQTKPESLRTISGKAYGGSAQSPDSEEEDDEKPTSRADRADKGLTRKRRFIKDKSKLRMQYK